MNTRTLLTLVAVAAVAFYASNCFAAKADVNDANKAEPNKATIISASDFGTFAKDVNKPDANKPAEPNKLAASEKGAEKGKAKAKGHAKKDVNEPNKPAEPKKDKETIISASDFGPLAKADVNDVNKPAEPKKDKLCAVSENAGKGCDKDVNKPADPNCKK